MVPPHSSKNLVGSKWVYKAKYRYDDSIERHKTCLIAQGFHQQLGIDYYEISIHVVQLATIRLILVVSLQWTIRQLDVKNVFLHDHLTEEVHMKQHPSFVRPDYPYFVCKL